jgi:hypothetical protein
MQMKQFNWKELPSKRKARFIVQALVQLTLTILALRDIRRRPASEIKGSKRLWTVLAFVQPIGPAAYFLFGRKR